ncbi:MAG: hypothetical protein MUF87_14140 [Anaerolineae bacterium]|nr:hypothetical protein [Anaerolineae bacterium]
MQKSHSLFNMARAIFDQQMWCWGCDVRRAEGNLLLAYGCIKHSAPIPKTPSAYQLWLDTDTTLTLWGWGIWIAQNGIGSLLIQRSGFRMTGITTPILSPSAWSEETLPLSAPSLNAEAQHHMILRVFQAIADYEQWLTTQVEPHYRLMTINAWPQKRHHKNHPTDLAAAWSQLAKHFTLKG